MNSANMCFPSSSMHNTNVQQLLNTNIYNKQIGHNIKTLNGLENIVNECMFLSNTFLWCCSFIYIRPLLYKCKERLCLIVPRDIHQGVPGILSIL